MSGVAIVGLACRFPGAPDATVFWELLRAGTDAIDDVPPDRWDADAWCAEEPTSDRMSTRWGGFVIGIDDFDSDFFGIARREAELMDPQQRLVLETSWAALEDGGVPAGSLAGSATGVFMGVATYDHGTYRLSELVEPDAYTGTGAALSIVANRLSYCLDLRGPSVAIDTACSSSLVAVHQAVRSLRDGECDVALAGGVNVILNPHIGVNFSQAGLMASDGRCKPFSARANGYVRGEGVGVVVLKGLADAVRDGDRIYAVVAGSAVNSDGRSNGLFAPNGPAQEAVLRAAYRRAEVDPSIVDYVEAHGTGTALGDPIEVGALGAVLGGGRRRPLRIGSVKSNVGHLEAAAGIAGLIKTTLALHHRELPRSIHFDQANPLLRLDRIPVEVQNEHQSWPDTGNQPTAGVSSFGFGGTNAHVVLTGVPGVRGVCGEGAYEPGAPLLVPLSARSEQGLADYTSAWAEQPLDSLRDAAYTAARRRDHHRHRAAVVVRDSSELAAATAALAAGHRHPAVVGPDARKSRRGPVFVFPGQGAQWEGMARGLAESVPVFRQTLERCDAAIARWAGQGVWDEGSGFTLDRTERIQPALFAMQVALGKTLLSWGVEPGAVLGHSMGEVAAAHVSGALSLDDAAAVICSRSSVLATLDGTGAMLMTELDHERADKLIAELGELSTELSVAASNGPRETVLSGSTKAVDECCRRIEADGGFARRVSVDFAAHSPQVAPLVPELRARLVGLEPAEPQVPFCSTVDAEPVAGQQLDAEHWGRNLRQPVLFAAAVRRLLDDGYDTFVELGPHPSVTRALQEQVGEQGALALLRRDADDLESAMRCIGELYTRGCDIDWGALFPTGRHRRVIAYPWQRRHFPRQPYPDPGQRRAPATGAPRDLLSSGIRIADDPSLHVHSVGMSDYLAAHVVDGTALAPATLWLAAAGSAARERCGTDAVELADVEISIPCPVERDGDQPQLIWRGTPADHARFTVASPASAGSVHTHATGRAGVAASFPDVPSLAELRRRCTETFPIERFYAALAARGLAYGHAFRGVTSLATTSGEALAEVALPDGLIAPEGEFHPALLDACLQVLGAAVGVESADGRTPMPVTADRVWSGPVPITEGWVHARVRAIDDDGIVGDVTLLAADGTTRWAVEGLGLRYVALRSRPEAGALYALRWRPYQSEHGAARRASWLVLTESGIGDDVVELLRRHGHHCVIGSNAAPEFLEEAQAGPHPFGGVLVAWEPGNGGPEALAVRLLDLVAELGAAAEPAPLWLLTHSTQAGASVLDEHAPTAAALWGLVRCLVAERPELTCRLIDLDGRPGPELLRLLADPNCPAEVSLRDQPLVPKLEQVTGTLSHTELPVRSDATYLITGGLGALGLHTAEFLADRGARHLLLLGRGEPQGAAQDVLEYLRRRGVDVRVVRADVTKLDELRAALDVGQPKLAGVIHAAGALEDADVSDVDASLLSRMLAPKLLGAWNLHEVTDGVPLDFFVVYSSLAGLLGSPGQAAYAAANTALDAFSTYRARLGLPTTSIAWGPWAESGLAVSSGGIKWLAEHGILALTSERGLTLFEEAIRSGRVHLAAGAFDPARWRDFDGRCSIVFADGDADAAPQDSEGPVAERILTLTARRERQQAMLAHVTTVIAEILRDDAVSLSPHVPLQETGFESVMALQLRNRLEIDLVIRLPAAVVWSHPTPAALSDELLRRLEGESEEVPTKDDFNLATLDDDQLAALIAGRVETDAWEDG